MTVLTLSVSDAAKATSLSPKTIRRKIEDGTLEAKKVDRRVLISYESLARLVSTRTHADK